MLNSSIDLLDNFVVKRQATIEPERTPPLFQYLNLAIPIMVHNQSGRINAILKMCNSEFMIIKVRNNSDQ